MARPDATSSRLNYRECTRCVDVGGRSFRVGDVVVGFEFCGGRKLSVAWCRLVRGFVTLVGCRGRELSIQEAVSVGQSVRQGARRRALEAQALRRREQVEVERRRSALGVDVVVALSERDAAIARWERLAGEALVKLTRDERLTLRDACEWAGDLTLAEAKRLRRLADED